MSKSTVKPAVRKDRKPLPSGTVTSAGGTAEHDVQLLAMPSDSRPALAEMVRNEKKSTYEVNPNGPLSATVTKLDGTLDPPSYTCYIIDPDEEEGNCSCDDWKYRHGRAGRPWCKHLGLLKLALGL